MGIIQSNDREQIDFKKNKQSLRDIWLYNRRSNLYIFGVPEGDVKDREDEKKK